MGFSRFIRRAILLCCFPHAILVAATVQTSDFCLAQSELSGWARWSYPCTTWNASALWTASESCGAVDGGAYFWTDKGLLDYVYQEYENAGKSAQVYIMDYQDTSHVADMFQSECGQAAGVVPSVTLPNYSSDVARMYVYGSGSTYEIYRVIGQFYVKIALLDMVDQADATRTAEMLLGILVSKASPSHARPRLSPVRMPALRDVTLRSIIYLYDLCGRRLSRKDPNLASDPASRVVVRVDGNRATRAAVENSR